MTLLWEVWRVWRDRLIESLAERDHTPECLLSQRSARLSWRSSLSRLHPQVHMFSTVSTRPSWTRRQQPCMPQGLQNQLLVFFSQWHRSQIRWKHPWGSPYPRKHIQHQRFCRRRPCQQWQRHQKSLPLGLQPRVLPSRAAHAKKEERRKRHQRAKRIAVRTDAPTQMEAFGNGALWEWWHLLQCRSALSGPESLEPSAIYSRVAFRMTVPRQIAHARVLAR